MKLVSKEVMEIKDVPEFEAGDLCLLGTGDRFLVIDDKARAINATGWMDMYISPDKKNDWRVVEVYKIGKHIRSNGFRNLFEASINDLVRDNYVEVVWSED